MQFTRSLITVVAALAIGTLSGSVRADEVQLKDGSKIVGTIKSMTGGMLTITTKFAGDLSIKAEEVAGFTSDRKLVVTLDSGDRVVGTPVYTPEGQKVTGTQFGDVTVKNNAVTGAWAAGDAPAANAEAQAQITELQKKHNAEVAELKAANEKLKGKWSGKVELGITGATGNTERVAMRARIEAKRTEENERLLLYLQGKFAQENGNESENEIFGGAKLERDVSPRFFWFARTELERDEFEDLKLRATASGGMGYFFFKEEKQEFKVRAGAGVLHESFDTGDNETSLIGELGYDYRLDVQDWLRFTHAMTFYTPFEDFGAFRVVFDTAGEVPLAKSEAWKLRVGMRNDYNADPKPGIESLDTTYFLNLVYNWE
ncbi:MAG: DUF481 domain-containing protein [Phycisphaera sp.]|nr:DUF481 domain-containing protein [Phycisphaera sp.]